MPFHLGFRWSRSESLSSVVPAPAGVSSAGMLPSTPGAEAGGLCTCVAKLANLIIAGS